jgi:rRNA maturation endonuclease Nob1
MSWHTECTCDYYYPNVQVNVQVIDNGIEFLEIHGAKPVIKPFIYCPYCGKKLKKIYDKTDKELEEEGQLRLL